MTGTESLMQCRYPGGPGCENATPDGPCCGQIVSAPFRCSRERFNRLYDALALIENGCELADESVWPYISRIYEIAHEALDADRMERA